MNSNTLNMAHHHLHHTVIDLQHPQRQFARLRWNEILQSLEQDARNAEIRQDQERQINERDLHGLYQKEMHDRLEAQQHSFEAILANQTHYIEKLQRKVETKEIELNEKNRQVRARDYTISQYQLNEKDQEIARLKQQLAHKDQVINQYKVTTEMINSDYKNAINDKHQLQKHIQEWSNCYNDTRFGKQIEEKGNPEWELKMAQAVIHRQVDEINNLRHRLENVKITLEKVIEEKAKETVRDPTLLEQTHRAAEAEWALQTAQGVIHSKIDKIDNLEIQIENLKLAYLKEIQEKEKEIGSLQWQLQGEADVSSESGNEYSSAFTGPAGEDNKVGTAKHG
jgi:hypothetical protein